VPRTLEGIAYYMNQPELPELARHFLYNQLNPNIFNTGADIPLNSCPMITSKVYLFSSAHAVYYAPSDLCGTEGMHSERIRAVKSWYKGAPRYDPVFVGKSDDPGFMGLYVARVFVFFSFKHEGINYPCALIQWFSTVGNTPCDETGMWIVKPEVEITNHRKKRVLAVVHLDSLLRGAHLIGVSGKEFLPTNGFDFSMSLDAFKVFYVNRYADYHAHETI
jgi:hypothetical protein